MASFVYQSFEPGLFTVGFYDPSGKWVPESDCPDKDEAARRCVVLNGGDPSFYGLSCSGVLALLQQVAKDMIRFRADRAGHLDSKTDVAIEDWRERITRIVGRIVG